MKTEYRRLALLTRGRFGKVWLLRCTENGYLMASKELTAGRSHLAAFRRELLSLSRLDHPHVITHHGYYHDPIRDTLGIVTHFCEGGDLFCYLEIRRIQQKPLAKQTLIRWFGQLCSAISYIHLENVLHGAISPWSIFLTGGEDLMIGGFSVSRFLDNWTADVPRHRPLRELRYVAPEVRCGKPLSFLSDLWSLGCVMYELYTLEHPLKDYDFQPTEEALKSLPSLLQCPYGFLIEDMLRINPEERPIFRSFNI